MTLAVPEELTNRRCCCRVFVSSPRGKWTGRSDRVPRRIGWWLFAPGITVSL